MAVDTGNGEKRQKTLNEFCDLAGKEKSSKEISLSGG